MNKRLIFGFLLPCLAAVMACSLVPSKAPEIPLLKKATLTFTASPTASETPTSTPELSTQTPEPAPTPMVVEGRGDKVINLPDQEMRFVKFSYRGEGYVSLEGYGDVNNYHYYVGSGSGSFYEIYPINDNEFMMINRLSVKIRQIFDPVEKEPWTIEIVAPESEEWRSIHTPGELEGEGPEVIEIAEPIDILTLDAKTKETGTVVVFAVQNNMDTMIVTGTGPSYQGEVVVPNGSIYLVINCSGAWKMTTQ